MITINHVTKTYGPTVALDDLSLEFDTPGLVCLLGRNGAGKTTLLRSIAGQIPISAGHLTVDGLPVDPLHQPAGVRLVSPDAVHFNARLATLLRDAAAINPAFDLDAATDLAGAFRLDLRKRFGALSFGMRSQFNAVLALSSGSSTLLLDEPVLGFDPVMRTRFYEVLAATVTDRAITAVVSTHIIDEIARVAERLVIIDRGRVRLTATVADLDETAYSVTGPAEAVRAATDGLTVLSELSAGGFVTRLIHDRRIEPTDAVAVRALGLQEFFVALVGDDPADPLAPHHLTERTVA